MAGIVFHLNEASRARHAAALANIRNLLAEMPDVKVELVIQGDAIDAVIRRDQDLGDQIHALSQQGVVFAVCRNTMRSRGLTRDDLLEDVTVVPSAVGELLRRQLEGYAYIKP